MTVQSTADTGTAPVQSAAIATTAGVPLPVAAGLLGFTVVKGSRVHIRRLPFEGCGVVSLCQGVPFKSKILESGLDVLYAVQQNRVCTQCMQAVTQWQVGPILFQVYRLRNNKVPALQEGLRWVGYQV